MAAEGGRPDDPGIPSEPLWAELGLLATQLARDAGALILDLATAARLDTATKSSPTDLVTAADRASEAMITGVLATSRPGDGVAGEEGTNRAGTSGVVWHIDPIDGTTNYVYAIPAFSVSIGVECDGLLVAGAVFNPMRNELFRAVSGAGAWRNDQPIRCSPRPDLATALAATGFGYQPDRRRHQAQVLAEVLPLVRDIRRFGSAALDLCATACGEVDVYWERGLNQWDLAAGTVIAREAGAVVENLRGGPPDAGCLVAAPPELFAPLRRLLIDAGADTGP
jgi:myo-inositol-1(or 4)-monophosphatase